MWSDINTNSYIWHKRRAISKPNYFDVLSLGEQLISYLPCVYIHYMKHQRIFITILMEGSLAL